MSKVLFILHYPPPVHGAAKVGEFIKNSTVVNKDFDCRYVNLSTSITVNEIGKGRFSKWVRYVKIIWKSYKELKNFKPDLVYLTLTTTGIGFYKDALVALMVKAFKIPLTYHFHNKGIKTMQHRWFDHQLYRRTMKNVDIILLSKYLYPDIEKYVPLNRVFYCANGIPKSLVEIKQKEITQTNPVVQILFLSNLIKSKGVDVLIQACRLLKEEGCEFKCVFVGGEGDISVKQFQSKIEDLEVEDRIYYAGRKYNEEKEEAYLSADIFVLPTMYKNECFPLVLLEAMQYALPVISTNEGGIPEIVENEVNGFMIKNQTPKKLAKKLAILIKDPNLRLQMGQRGRAKYLENFTQDVFENNFVSVLKKIMES